MFYKFPLCRIIAGWMGHWAQRKDSNHPDFCTEYFLSLGWVTITNSCLFIPWVGNSTLVTTSRVLYSPLWFLLHPAYIFMNCPFVELSLNFSIGIPKFLIYFFPWSLSRMQNKTLCTMIILIQNVYKVKDPKERQ